MFFTDVGASAYGGALVNLFVSEDRARDLRRQSALWPSWDLTPPQCALVELLATGALSPLRGFMSRRDYDAVCASRRLPDGRLWVLPVTLEVADTLARIVHPGSTVALRDPEGVMLAALRVDEVWTAGAPDGSQQASYLGGALEVIGVAHTDFRPLRLVPADLRQQLASDRSELIGLHAVQPLNVSVARHAETVRRARNGRLLIHAISAAAAADDTAHFRRVRRHRAAIAHFPSDAALVGLLPLPACATPEDDMVARAIVSRNFGCSHLLIPHDAYVDPELVEREIGIRVLRMPPGASVETAPEAERDHEDMRQGFAVFFTGLSGSGKSTICNLVLVKLQEMTGRAVTLLDGDLVRKHLSSELGFSPEHREINIRRIGFVASEIAKHGGIAMCAPIAPYARTRAEVRAMVQAVGGFVLVHVATPLEVCEARDRKGLYAKARAGLIAQFTGISDPYEAPVDAELTIDTSTISAEHAAELIVEYLRSRGFLDTNSRVLR